MSFEKRGRRVQEDSLDRYDYIESVQHHFQERIGKKDYAHIGAGPFTLRFEEAEQILDQAGGCNRDAMALILRAMNYVDQRFTALSKDMSFIRFNLEEFSQDARVENFLLKLKDQIRTTKARQQAKETEHAGQREFVAA